MPKGVPPKLKQDVGDMYDPSTRFQGEWMHCKGCGRKEKSSPKKESNWTYVQVDDSGFYICPFCFKNGLLQPLIMAHAAGH